MSRLLFVILGLLVFAAVPFFSACAGGEDLSKEHKQLHKEMSVYYTKLSVLLPNGAKGEIYYSPRALARDKETPGYIGADIYHIHPHSFETVHGRHIEVERIIHIFANEDRWVDGATIDYRDSNGHYGAYISPTVYDLKTGTTEFNLSSEEKVNLLFLAQMLFAQIYKADKDKIEGLLAGK